MCYTFYLDFVYKSKKKRVMLMPLKVVEKAEEYKERGKKYIPVSKYTVWASIVDRSLHSIYAGLELNALLALLPYVERGNWKKAKAVFDLQAHSGNSANLIFGELRELLSNTSVDVEGFIAYLKQS